jgi:hypothetical protein
LPFVAYLAEVKGISQTDSKSLRRSTGLAAALNARQNRSPKRTMAKSLHTGSNIILNNLPETANRPVCCKPGIHIANFFHSIRHSLPQLPRLISSRVNGRHAWL